MPYVFARKPQVAFSERRKDPNLHRLTIAQLRNTARKQQLDVSLLTHKWEFVHALLAPAQEHVERIPDAQRKTIFDLPGEIRNKVYSYVLVDEEPVLAHYGKDSLTEYIMEIKRRLEYNSFDAFLGSITRGSTPAKQLLAMSWTSRKLRGEVRAFFFAYNHFRVMSLKFASHSNFLADIGADGRMNITKLEYAGRSTLHCNEAFANMICTCVQLRELDICVHVGDILDRDTYKAFRRYLRGEDELQKLDVSIVFSSILNIFTLLPSLEKLQLGVATPCWTPGFLTHPHMPRYRQELVTEAIGHAVKKKLEWLLEEKKVQVEIKMRGGGQELSCDEVDE